MLRIGNLVVSYDISVTSALVKQVAKPPLLYPGPF